MLITFSKYIEQKWFHIIIKGLVIEKQLSQKAQILRIELKKSINKLIRIWIHKKLQKNVF